MDDKDKYSLKSLLDNANDKLDILMKELKTGTQKDIDVIKNTINKDILNKEELTLDKEEIPTITLDKEEEELNLEKEEENSLKKLEDNVTAKTDTLTNSGNEVLEKALDSAKKIEEKVNRILNLFS